MKASLSTTLCLFVLPSLAGAASIGINFIDSDDVSFGTASAGAPGYEQANWNHPTGDWSGVAGNDALFTAGLVDSDGTSVAGVLQNIAYAAHSDTIHYDSATTWRSGAGNGDANATLLNGYLDDGGNNQPYLNLSLAPDVYDSYTVVIYINGDAQNGPVGRYWLEEWTDPLAEGTVITDQIGVSDNSYSGTFISAGEYNATATPTNLDIATGNYIVFQGVTVRNLRVRSAGNGDPEDFGRGPLNAVQIIDNTNDRDSDGLPDAWEIANNLNPDDDGTIDPVNGPDGNPDGDGLTNLEEFERGTKPRLMDTDGDNLNDEVENDSRVWVDATNTGTNPRVADTDGDGFNDDIEDNSGVFNGAADPGTNPNLRDSDMDGTDDDWEVANSFDPNSDVGDDGGDGDPDNDDSPNTEEFARGTLPRDDDSDGDNLLDGHETDTRIYVSATDTGTDPLDADTDDDFLPDDTETGAPSSTDPNLADTDGDFLRDDWEPANGRNPLDVNDGLTAALGAIGINFGAGRGATATLLADDVTGIARHANWNNLSGATGGPVTLNDATGTGSGATITWATDEEWSAGTGADPDGTMLAGWLSANVSDDSNTLKIENIPYAAYDLVVYFNHDRGTEDVDFGEANGAFTTVRLHESNPDVGAAAPLVQQVATAEGDAAQVGTFYVITGLSAATLDLVLNAAGGEGSVDRGAITGIQIVASPETGELAITDITRTPSTTAGMIDVTITWRSKPDTTYGIFAGETLADFEEIDDAQALGTTTSYTDTIPAATAKRFYKIGPL